MGVEAMNPNHPVTALMQANALQLVALLLSKFNLGEVVITKEDIDRVSGAIDNVVLAHSKKDALIVKLVSREEAERLACEHGGRSH